MGGFEQKENNWGSGQPEKIDCFIKDNKDFHMGPPFSTVVVPLSSHGDLLKLLKGNNVRTARRLACDQSHSVMWSLGILSATLLAGAYLAFRCLRKKPKRNILPL